MKISSTIARATLMCLASGLFLITASADDRPVKKNKDFQPLAVTASAYPFVTTGLVAKIKSASIAKDGVITVRFTISDSKGGGLDVNGVLTAGTLAIRFIAAYIPTGKTQYVSYNTTTVAATSNKNPSQVQAGTDTNGKFTLVDAATGTYDYTFGTKAPATFDAAATHTIGMQADRNLTEFGIEGNYTADEVFNFVPNGSPVTNVRDIINESSCNGCHDPISAHGGARKKMTYCVLCHTPQSVNPDTLVTADMPVFIHKLHMGSSLPSVKAGNKYFMVHRGAVADYSDIAYPQDIRNCTSCHAAGTKQADNWKTKPSRAVCGSCHDEVNFATGANHANLPQFDDKQCTTCHNDKATQDFDLSIPGAHVVPNRSTSLPGVIAQILRIDNTNPGQAPIVTFRVSDKAGNPLDATKLATLRIILSGPNADYNTGPGAIRASENPVTAANNALQGGNGQYTYNMTNKVPAAATGSYTISIESRNSVTLMPNTTKATAATDMGKPVQMYFSVDKSPMQARRAVVSTEKCGACHQNLGFIHGGSRAETQECVICHNPTFTNSASKATLSFAGQIHSTHRGEELSKPYVIGATNYQEVRYPGDLRNCAACHVNATYRVENVGGVAAVSTPSGLNSTTPPISAACLGCHDDRPSAVHAIINTTQFGESCESCHGINGEFSVDKVHARH